MVIRTEYLVSSLRDLKDRKKMRACRDSNPSLRLSLDLMGPPEASVISKLHYKPRSHMEKGLIKVVELSLIHI